MYEDVAKKIRGLAIGLGILFIVAGTIAWFALITNSYTYWGEIIYITEDDWIGWLSLAVGGLYFMTTWMLYGFGVIVEDVQGIYGLTYKLVSKIEKKEREEAQNSMNGSANSIVRQPNQVVPSQVNVSAESRMEVPKKKYCPQCGTECHPSNKYCNSCGRCLE